jgi:hypothetical protein
MLQRLIEKAYQWACKDPTKYYYANGDEIITMGHQLLLDLVTPNNTNMEEDKVQTTALTVRPKTYYATSAIDAYILEPYVTKRSGRVIAKARRAPIMTIAAIYKVEEGAMVYGISICSSDDEFHPKEGRKRAKERMDQGFCVIRYVPKNTVFSPEQIQEFLKTTCEGIIAVFETEVIVQGKLHSKFERRIAAFKMDKVLSGEVVV